jgi:hypothetical protein
MEGPPLLLKRPNLLLVPGRPVPRLYVRLSLYLLASNGSACLHAGRSAATGREGDGGICPSAEKENRLFLVRGAPVPPLFLPCSSPSPGACCWERVQGTRVLPRRGWRGGLRSAPDKRRFAMGAGCESPHLFIIGWQEAFERASVGMRQESRAGHEKGDCGGISMDRSLLMMLGLISLGTVGGALSGRLPLSGTVSLGLALLPLGALALTRAFC